MIAGGYMNQLDLAVLILVALSAFAGLRAGLIQAVGDLLAFLAGLWTAWHFRLGLVYYAENKLGLVTFLEDWLRQHIAFFQVFPSTAASQPEEQARFQTWFTQIRELFLPQISVDFNPAEQMAVILLSVAAFALIFTVVRFILGLIFHLLQRLIDLTPLHLVNHWLGLVFGTLKGILYCGLALFLFSPLFTTGAFLGWSWGGKVMRELDTSLFYGFFLHGMTGVQSCLEKLF
jgi:uncharacterized membrane protein required for colicin V production